MPSSTSNRRSASSAIDFSHALLGLDLGEPFDGHVGGHADLAAVLVDLLLDHLLDLAEVGGDVEVEASRPACAISASAALIFSSASYFWIFLRTSASFSLACLIFFRLLS